MSNPLKIGVIGHPITHSQSPVIHNYWLQTYDLEGKYDAIDIKPEDLKTRIQDIIEQGYKGFNVTVPYKERILELCDKIDMTAKAIGAVNTVIIENGQLCGRNTDAYGFIQNIKDHPPNFEFQGSSALILGSGGAARAALYGLLKEGVTKIYIANRTREKAEILSKDFEGNIVVIDWKDRSQYCQNIDLLVNTTSLGMTGKPPLELNLDQLNSETLVCDIVYSPLMTDLLTQAQNQGNPIVTGIGMLLHQARPAFEAWTGILPDITDELIDIVIPNKN